MFSDVQLSCISNIFFWLQKLNLFIFDIYGKNSPPHLIFINEVNSLHNMHFFKNKITSMS